jgi:hypothetical protein
MACIGSPEGAAAQQGKYGDSGYARMTTTAAAYSVEKERCERAAGVYFRAVKAAPRWI